MATKGDFGRIYFPGNPWPKGHQIVECCWSGRIERSTGVWFDFHIVSEAFDAADKGRRFPDEDDNLGPTESRALWCNHHHMILSTTNWPGLAYGFHAGSREEPFDYRKLSGRVFQVDNPPISEGYPRPLAVYRWGHEHVAYSAVAFKKESGSKTFSISWSGQVGGFSHGSPDFPYQFNMKLKKVAFAGIHLPVHVECSDAFALAEPYVRDSRKYKFLRRKNDAVLIPQ